MMASSGSQQAAAAGSLAPTPAARAFLSRFSDGMKMAFAARRPWKEVVDWSSFARPESVAEAVSRLRKNVGYFKINYLVVVLGCIAASLVYHPLSLFTLGVLAFAWYYLYLVRTDSLVLFNRSFSEREVMIIMSVISVMVVFLLSDVGSLLLSALTIGAVAVSVHGAFRVPDDLFLDEQEGSAGFLSFLGPSGSNPPVASHV